jgi:hypothetical protein
MKSRSARSVRATGNTEPLRGDREHRCVGFDRADLAGDHYDVEPHLRGRETGGSLFALRLS